MLNPFVTAEPGGRNPLPRVHLTWNLENALPLAGGPMRGQCDCDCACAVGGQMPLPTLSGPVTCYFELTFTCPNHCPGCGNVSIDRQTDGGVLPPPLSLQQWTRILDKLLPSVTLFKLTGGEPTTYPDFFPFLALLKEMQVPFVLLTNGLWSEPQRLLNVLSACPAFRGFLISLHGPDAFAHEQFTATPGSFMRAAASIRAAAADGFAVATNAVLFQANLGRLRETADLALSLGANHVLFGRYIGLPRPNLTLSEEYLREAIGEVQAMEDIGLPVKFGNCIPQCFEPSSSLGCTAGCSFCTVDPWGNVRPCNHTQMTAGNLLDQPLDEIWWSEAMDRWREPASPSCVDCAAYAHCHGGCRALSLELGADPLVRAPVDGLAVSAQPHITLYAGAVPQRRYVVRHESFGPVLLFDGRVLPVSDATLSLLSQIVGHRTLGEIAETAGEAALSFIGALYTQRFVDLVVPGAP